MDEVRAILEIGEARQEYVFAMDRRQTPPVLHIPGDHRGPDLCIPRKPEQEKWLDSLFEIMTPLWHCQWQFRSAQACDEFVEYLENEARREQE